MRWVWVVVGAYLVGSVPFSYLIVWLVRRTDVRTVGSGNVGATNVLRAAGRLPGVLALLLDAGKGMAAVLGARALAAPQAVVAAAALAVVVGHVFPVFLGFRGGKGVATAAGALGILSPWALLLSAAVFAAVLAWSRYVSLGSIIAVSLFPLFLWLHASLSGQPRPRRAVLGCAAATAALIVVKHRGNIARLLAGTERRLGER
ncbi:MAG TPA: glycerol-3-phosphate 1-O-acyltransferase PlsY [Thermoanaerobaculia bacterium]|nr:glycerol-3-phosphate 1-O-acyltransferase PlsY [Thermoanaerobaculia bacterium]